jgi:hypothetical protein
VYEAAADASFLHVYNAQTMDSKPLAVVSGYALLENLQDFLDHTEMHQLSLQSTLPAILCMCNLVEACRALAISRSVARSPVRIGCPLCIATWGQESPLPSMHVWLRVYMYGCVCSLQDMFERMLGYAALRSFDVPLPLLLSAAAAAAGEAATACASRLPHLLDERRADQAAAAARLCAAALSSSAVLILGVRWL